MSSVLTEGESAGGREGGSVCLECACVCWPGRDSQRRWGGQTSEKVQELILGHLEKELV